jgi:hypothetical protein
MRIDKKRLREVLVEHCIKHEIPKNHLVRERPYTLGHMTEILRKGRRDRNTPDYWAAQVIRCVERTYRNMGYDVQDEPEPNRVCVRMFIWGNQRTWVCMPKDVAEKILVFGTVPDLRF